MISDVRLIESFTSLLLLLTYCVTVVQSIIARLKMGYFCRCLKEICKRHFCHNFKHALRPEHLASCAVFQGLNMNVSLIICVYSVFLPCDAIQSAVMPQYAICPSVHLSVSPSVRDDQVL